MLQKVTKPRACECQLCLVQGSKRFPKMDEHQVALMPEQGEQSRLSDRVLLHLFENFCGFANDLVFLHTAQLPPRGPAELHHLMKNAVTLDGERHLWERGCLRTRCTSSRHRLAKRGCTYFISANRTQCRAICRSSSVGITRTAHPLFAALICSASLSLADWSKTIPRYWRREQTLERHNL